MELTEINKSISLLKDDEKNLVSDGYHTFGELYEHRIHLFILLVNETLNNNRYIWKKSKTHFDGTSRDGRFIVQGYILNKDLIMEQISYHLPDKYYDNILCKSSEVADERDGHTSQDVLDRLLKL